MKASSVVTLGFLWLIGVSSSANAQSSSGIQNGSFEAPSIASYAYRPSGGNWTFISSAGIQHIGSAWGAPNAPDGVQTAFLQDGTTGGNGTISQLFNVPADGTYAVSFYSALRAYRTSPTLMSFNVTMDGTNIGSFSPTATAFSQFTTSSTRLTAGTHTLSFVGTGTAPDTSDFIDFVTLNNTSAQVPPSNTAPPTIAGTPQVGRTLIGATGTWNNATSFAEKWFSNGVLLPGVTGLSYTPQNTDMGHVITEIVTATGPGGTASATSAPTTPVASGGSFASCGASPTIMVGRQAWYNQTPKLPWSCQSNGQGEYIFEVRCTSVGVCDTSFVDQGIRPFTRSQFVSSDNINDGFHVPFNTQYHATYSVMVESPPAGDYAFGGALQQIHGDVTFGQFWLTLHDDGQICAQSFSPASNTRPVAEGCRFFQRDIWHTVDLTIIDVNQANSNGMVRLILDGTTLVNYSGQTGTAGNNFDFATIGVYAQYPTDPTAHVLKVHFKDTHFEGR